MNEKARELVSDEQIDSILGEMSMPGQSDNIKAYASRLTAAFLNMKLRLEPILSAAEAKGREEERKGKAMNDILEVTIEVRANTPMWNQLQAAGLRHEPVTISVNGVESPVVITSMVVTDRWPVGVVSQYTARGVHI